VLASGSSGNATIVENSESAVLIDCGLSVRGLEQRALALAFDLSRLDAIAVTHEHGDHIGGVAALARRYRIPVYMTGGTRRAAAFETERDVDVRDISPHEAFTVGTLALHPAPVPHDAKEPCQYVVTSARERLGVLTDFGSETAHIHQHFADCNALVLEFNHDPAMLSDCEYPESVKERIAGRHGHVNNAQARDLLEVLRSNRLRHVLAAHISKHANDTSLVGDILRDSLEGANVGWGLASQDQVTPWISL
jgi:phosphoribosyl 1,2-cyclic phosphodiesterase